MLIIIPIVLVSLVIVAALRPHRSGARVEHLGTMSEQWLAECNASRRTPLQ